MLAMPMLGLTIIIILELKPLDVLFRGVHGSQMIKL